MAAPHDEPPIGRVDMVKEKYWGALPVRSFSIVTSGRRWRIMVELTSDYVDNYQLRIVDKVEGVLVASVERWRTTHRPGAKMPFDPLQEEVKSGEIKGNIQSETARRSMVDNDKNRILSIDACFSIQANSAPGFNANFVYGVLVERGLNKWTLAAKDEGDWWNIYMLEWCICVLDALESKGAVEVGSTMLFVRYINARHKQLNADPDSEESAKAQNVKLPIGEDLDRLRRKLKNFVGTGDLMSVELTGQRKT